jgi:hypothetical protein
LTALASKSLDDLAAEQIQKVVSPALVHVTKVASAARCCRRTLLFFEYTRIFAYLYVRQARQRFLAHRPAQLRYAGSKSLGSHLCSFSTQGNANAAKCLPFSTRPLHPPCCCGFVCAFVFVSSVSFIRWVVVDVLANFFRWSIERSIFFRMSRMFRSKIQRIQRFWRLMRWKAMARFVVFPLV